MNQCQLLGRMTRDPELKYTPQGTAVVSFSLAVASTERRPTSLTSWPGDRPPNSFRSTSRKEPGSPSSVRSRPEPGKTTKATKERPSKSWLIPSISLTRRKTLKPAVTPRRPSLRKGSKKSLLMTGTFHSNLTWWKGGEEKWTNRKKVKSEQGSWIYFGTTTRKRAS